jgi:hypothetical protein
MGKVNIVINKIFGQIFAIGFAFLFVTLILLFGALTGIAYIVSTRVNF